MSNLPQTFKAAVLEAPEQLKIKDVPMLKPAAKEILVRISACGFCGSDCHICNGAFPVAYPRVPGHEFVGEVVSVGSEVTRFKGGERVGGMWHGGHDGTCVNCKSGLSQYCQNGAVNGVTRDGGFAEFATLREEAVVNIPREMDSAEAAPLLCAGLTVYNGLRQIKDVEQGALVAVQGLGGLGHLAVQYARAMGFRVAAMSRGNDKRELAMKLGANEYIDTSNGTEIEQLTKLGGAAVIVITAPDPKAIGPLAQGLRIGGTLLVLSVTGNIEIATPSLILKGASIKGWLTGHVKDAEETLAFAQKHGIKCMIEKFPLEQVEAAYKHTASTNVRFRSVLVME